MKNKYVGTRRVRMTKEESSKNENDKMISYHGNIKSKRKLDYNNYFQKYKENLKISDQQRVIFSIKISLATCDQQMHQQI